MLTSALPSACGRRRKRRSVLWTLSSALGGPGSKPHKGKSDEIAAVSFFMEAQISGEEIYQDINIHCSDGNSFVVFLFFSIDHYFVVFNISDLLMLC